jgi:hypothetical protein
MAVGDPANVSPGWKPPLVADIAYSSIARFTSVTRTTSCSTFALVFSSGCLADLGALTALCRPGTLIASDQHKHASIGQTR